MLPISTIIDTHEALEDWRFTAQESNQVIASVWGSVMGAIVFAAMTGMFNMVVSGNPSNPKKKTIAEYEKEITVAYLQGNNERAHQLEKELYKAYPKWAKGDIPDKDDYEKDK